MIRNVVFSISFLSFIVYILFNLVKSCFHKCLMAIMTLLNELDLFHALNMIMDRVGDLEDYIFRGGVLCYVQAYWLEQFEYK